MDAARRHNKDNSMRFPFSLPWRRPADGRAVPERKTATGGFMAVAAQGGQAFWSGRSYAALAREGFMKNPVAHRAARMVAEASASSAGCFTMAMRR